MSDQPSSVVDVEKLLRDAGVGQPTQPGVQRKRPAAPVRGPLRRFGRRVRHTLLFLLFFLAAEVGLLLYTSTGVATDPFNAPNALSKLPWYGAVDPRLGIEEAFRAPRQAASVPIGWERIPFFWSSIQQSGPDSWNQFAMNHDTQINQELQSGRQVVGLLINTPDWAATQPSQHGASVPKGLYLPYNDPDNYWGHFVGMVAKRYARRINDWIIWNEVNIPSGQWKTWDGTQADYAQLVKVAYLAARAANPQAQIILAGDPYWYDHGALFQNLLHILSSDPQAAANDDYFDAANLHLYSSPLEMISIVNWYRAAMAKIGINKPIWISEMNVVPYNDSVRPYPKGNLRATTDEQANYVVQAFAIDLALGVGRVEVNRMLDGSDFQAGGEPLGLVRNDGTVRPAFYAYRTAATIFAGVTGGSIHADTLTGVYSVTLQRPGATITVLWDQKPLPATVTLPVRTGALFYDKFGEPATVPISKDLARLQLAGATATINTADPTAYVIGGNPIIVVQPS
jgi:hypothetical protein